MASDFEDRRQQRRVRVKQLEQRLKSLRRKQSRRNRRRALRPWRNLVLLVGLGIAAWILLPRLFDSAAPRDAITETRDATRRQIEELQESIVEDVSETVGVDIERRGRAIELDPTITDWSIPLDRIDASRATRPHHSYAAWDYGTRVGTPSYAMTHGVVAVATTDDGGRCGGTVTIMTSAERARITYCHLSEIVISEGEIVHAGDLIGRTGGEPGTVGAGRSSGPHLHLQITLEGELRCPQTQIVALSVGQPMSVRDLPTAGCSYTPAALPDRSDAYAFAAQGDTHPDPDDPLAIWDP